MGLRTDSRQWLIYDDDTLGAVVRMSEAACLSIVGQRLARHPDIELRALGNLWMRMGEQRTMSHILDDSQLGEAARAMTEAMRYAFNGGPKPAVLDELHAAAYRIDDKATGAGVVGPGVVRELVRGD